MSEAAAPLATAPTTASSTANQTGLAAIAYILTWITGLVVFFVAKKDQRYARWNAIQAIGLGVAVLVLWGLYAMVWEIVTATVGTGMGSMAGLAAFALLTQLGVLTILVLVILCAVKAALGNPLRLPVLAAIADRSA